jgi:hypothetical protein
VSRPVANHPQAHAENADDPREAAVHCGLSYDLVLSKTFPSLLSLLRPSFLLNVIALHPFGSLWGRCARYFKTDRMRRAFSFGSMYLGSSPFDSPGTYSLLQWTETCEGIVSPEIGPFFEELANAPSGTPGADFTRWFNPS